MKIRVYIKSYVAIGELIESQGNGNSVNIICTS